MEELKVGDIIFAKDGDRIIGKYTIGRITKTQAIGNNTKGIECRFKRFYNMCIKCVGESTWCCTQYSLSTQELQQELHKQYVLFRINNVDMQEININKLEKIYKILKEE